MSTLLFYFTQLLKQFHDEPLLNEVLWGVHPKRKFYKLKKQCGFDAGKSELPCLGLFSRNGRPSHYFLFMKGDLDCPGYPLIF
jgi:hypothetical protein